MKFFAMLGWLACAGAGVGCAEMNAARVPAEPTGAPTRIYSENEIRVLMHLRDNGDGLADVAAVIGGTREDIKRAEAQEKLRRRLARTRGAEATALGYQTIAKVGS